MASEVNSNFDRRPSPGSGVQELRVPVGDCELSGLLAEPQRIDTKRPLIVAIHGAGMHAGYFDARSAPGLSLLELGSSLGFTVWAPDRPGIGQSTNLPPDRIRLRPQAELLLQAIDEFARLRCRNADAILVGHSYGLKVALAMAAGANASSILGVDGSGCGVTYADEPYLGTVSQGVRDRGISWGPENLYPAATFDRGSLPLHHMPEAQVAESDRWPTDIRAMAKDIRVPLRFTFGRHERFWPIDASSFEEIRTVFSRSSGVTIETEPNGGHNLSLGWAARSYHLRVLAFAEACRLALSLRQS